MNLGDLTERNAVLKAIQEFDDLGREHFLAKYGFGPARSYYLLYHDSQYDSKAIAGVAYGYQYPEHGPLKADMFSGGESTVAKLLRTLGFVVTSPSYHKHATKAWAFCANPKRYRIVEAVKHLEIDYWTIGRSKVSAGDRAIIWQTLNKDAHRGVVGLGQILGDPEIRTDNDNPYWIDPAEGLEPIARVPVQYIDAPFLPLWIDDSPTGEFLLTLSVARAHGGTVFSIKPNQWKKIIELAGVRTQPHTDEIEAAEKLRYRSRQSSGQGFGLNAEERKAVEKYAMQLALEYLRSHWDNVLDVSSRASFDLLCRRGDDELRVEVKGTTGTGEKVILTKNEVRESSKPRYALFVVSQINLNKNQKGDAMVSGGVCMFFSPWDSQKHHLEPLSYTCNLNLQAGILVD